MVFRLAVYGCLFALTPVPDPARAQTGETPLGTPDSVFENTSRTPVTYITSYDRDVSSGTWTQNVSYSMTQSHLALRTSGNYTAVDLTGGKNLGGTTGGIDGTLNFQASKRWILGLEGHFNKVSSTSYKYEAAQRQNRLKVTSQLNLAPARRLELRTLLSTELQQDHFLTLHLEQQPGIVTFSGSAGSDTLRSARDSIIAYGRQDGFNTAADWKPSGGFRLLTEASGNRNTPTFKSNFSGTDAGLYTTRENRTPIQQASGDYRYQTKASFARGATSIWMLLRRLHSDNQRLDRDKVHFIDDRIQLEHTLTDRRSGTMHVENSPFRGAQLVLDGTLERAFSTFVLRDYLTSLVSGKTLNSSFSYFPNPYDRVAIEFDLDNHTNERQSTSNGLKLFRFLQMNGSHRMSPRLSLTGGTSVSLLSFQYTGRDTTGDEDNLRTYLNVGANYTISPRCSTQVHFSSSRGHVIKIDPTQSGNNNVQTTYMLDALLKVGLSRSLQVAQNYLFSAFYQINDSPSLESRNSLNRNRRILTSVTDSLFPFASVQFVHDFNFRDSGTYSRPEGETVRRYNVASHLYVQSLAATLSMNPLRGIQLTISQILENSKTYRPDGPVDINNRWHLNIAGNVNREVSRGATLQGSVQHIGAYTERRATGGDLFQENTWVAGITFTKDFQ